jgi:hypothetical protein
MISTLTSLDNMVANAAKMGIGDRADKAAAIYLGETGTLSYLGYAGKMDHWHYGNNEGHNYTISYAGKICTCADSAAPRHEQLGKLCKHRIAVMFAIKIRDAGLAEIAHMLNCAEGGLLTVDIYYGEYQTYTVSAVRANGGASVKLEHPKSLGVGWYRFQIDPIDVAKALGSIGWGVSANTKQAGFAHTWTLASQVDFRTSLSVMRGMAGNVVDEKRAQGREAELESISDLV